MYQWIDFINFIFWFSLAGFLINFSNFLFLFLFSECVWLIVYSFSIIVGLNLEDLNLISNTFFVLGLAGIEFSLGFLLLILFKKFNINYNLVNETTFFNNLLIR